MRAWPWIVSTVVVFWLPACGGSEPADLCHAMPDGTRTCASSNATDADPSGNGYWCGPGTKAVGHECLPIPPDAQAAPGRPEAGAGGDRDAGDSGEPFDAGDSSLSSDASDADAITDAPIAYYDGGLDVSGACLGSVNTFVIAGDDWVHTGAPLTIQGGVGWSASTQSVVNGLPSYIQVNIGTNWFADFSTRSVGVPLLPGTYTNAQRAAFTDPNHPGLDVSGDGRGCNTIAGQFQVIDMQATSTVDGGAGTIQSFTVVFEQHCEGQAKFNVGCIHFQQ